MIAPPFGDSWSNAVNRVVFPLVIAPYVLARFGGLVMMIVATRRLARARDRYVAGRPRAERQEPAQHANETRARHTRRRDRPAARVWPPAFEDPQWRAERVDIFAVDLTPLGDPVLLRQVAIADWLSKAFVRLLVPALVGIALMLVVGRLS